MAIPRPPRKPSLAKMPKRQKSPSDIRQASIGKDVSEARASAIPFGWDVFRQFYDADVVAAAESLFDEASVNIQTVMMVQCADIFRVRRVLMAIDSDHADYMQLERLAAAQLKHLRLMAERHGANASSDSQMVQVPIGLELDLSDTRIFGDMNLVN